MKKFLAGSIFALGLLLGYLGRSIPFAEQFPIFSSLGTVAAIVFGLMGAWIAVIYPGALSNLTKRKDDIQSDGEILVSRLVVPMVISTIVVVLSLVVTSFSPLARRMLVGHLSSELLRGISFSLVSLLTLYLIYAVIVTMAPLDWIKSEAEAKADDARIRARKTERGSH